MATSSALARPVVSCLPAVAAVARPVDAWALATVVARARPVGPPAAACEFAWVALLTLALVEVAVELSALSPSEPLGWADVAVCKS